MDKQKKFGKKIWKPPSFEDFNLAAPTKKLKLDANDISEEVSNNVPNEVSEPKNVEELAIHPKKIEEVRNWIKWSSKERAPILLVTGPTGSGKTATVKVSAKAEGAIIKEWINPVDKTEFKNEAFIESDFYDRYSFYETKQTDKFEDFIFRSSRYSSLIDNTNANLIIVEDIPNIYVWKPKLFHEFLEKYKSHGKSPIIFMVTDDQTLNLQNDLFPNHIKIKHNVTNIKFNPVNNSCLMKNLKNLTEYYCSEKVSSQFLENISKNSGGDLRSATNDLLMFLRTTKCLNRIPNKPRKKLKKNDGLWAMSEPLSSKDSNFDFYHVVGRILYPKLITEKEKTNNPNQLFLHDVQKIAESWSSSFPGVLHENYLQTFGKFEDVVRGAECFSVLDTLGHYSELDQYSSLFGVISLMSNNKEPKKSGFNPLKKSIQVSKKLNCDLDSGLEVYNLSQRDILLDVAPFRKIIAQGQYVGTPNLHVGDESDSNDDDDDDDNIEIEEFDD